MQIYYREPNSHDANNRGLLPSGRPLRLRFLPSRFNDTTFTLLVYSVPLSMSLYVPRGGAFGQQMNNVFSIIEPSCSFTVTRYLRVR